ncbi:DNA phosphorothioation-dependent restriction protein DptF [Pseudoalteromonas ruthenica]|uniref:DNA phosphorothioation-dependent restriction protein DptF n=1 Tax=Pseudoalteromonas ruthenica TaxID=151081 RepID=UPI001244A86D|nr:DNA phosphorothioation-dependent restriction protein DptF [Pseudoalteromonas ruthenica]
MRLKEALSVLSKSSPYAVSTERSQDKQTLLDEIKSYLYIEMPIERRVDEVISSFGANDKKMLFLCGSSGDGKSELLTKAKQKYGSRVKFHLDATHSFDPHGTAIQTLDKVFGEFEAENSPLVVGINTGMMGNYAEEGSNERIRQALKTYLNDKQAPNDSGIYFVSFEDYPKFEIREHDYSSEFATSLLARITQQDDNIIRQLVEKEKEYGSAQSKRLVTNYELLSLPSVQKVIVDLLFKARLMRDQFLTARALLDFIHELLLGKGYLFDNLFAGGGNELANKIEGFDPAHLRTKQIDRFILCLDLNLPNPEFTAFKEVSSDFGITKISSAAQYLRLFYVLRHSDFANNFHLQFNPDFNESLVEKYISVFRLHKQYLGTAEQKSELKSFYRDILISAVRSYINRNAPRLGKRYFLLSDFGDYQVAAPADLAMDAKAIANNSTTSNAFFNARLKLKDKQFCLPININLLSLLININNGYRPNKHDKDSVILLDELANEVVQAAKSADELIITGGGKKYELELDDDEIVVNEG